jgi:hypothetical protein
MKYAVFKYEVEALRDITNRFMSNSANIPFVGEAAGNTPKG